jgi:hypothetical protein
MRKIEKPSPTESPLLFAFDPKPAEEIKAAGGECLDDFERLRADPGLGELLGHEVPSPEAARKFLYAFHEEEKIQQAKQQRLAGQNCLYSLRE